MVIAIDGKSATGKSTIAFNLAQKLNLTYLNSGSIYRCIALKIMNKEININDDNLLEKLNKLHIEFKMEKSIQKVYLDNIDVTKRIRLEDITVFTPKIADNKIIKEYIRNIQYTFVKKGNIVIEGRDIATRIAPNANYKFYLYATSEIRAKRVYEEKIKEENISYEEVLNDIEKRDKEDILDENFIEPKNAIRIDTSFKSKEEILNIILSYIKEKNL